MGRGWGRVLIRYIRLKSQPVVVCLSWPLSKPTPRLWHRTRRKHQCSRFMVAPLSIADRSADNISNREWNSLCHLRVVIQTGTINSDFNPVAAVCMLRSSMMVWRTVAAEKLAPWWRKIFQCHRRRESSWCESGWHRFRSMKERQQNQQLH